MQKKREYFLGPIERYSQSLYRVCMKTNTKPLVLRQSLVHKWVSPVKLIVISQYAKKKESTF